MRRCAIAACLRSSGGKSSVVTQIARHTVLSTVYACLAAVPGRKCGWRAIRLLWLRGFRKCCAMPGSLMYYLPRTMSCAPPQSLKITAVAVTGNKTSARAPAQVDFLFRRRCGLWMDRPGQDKLFGQFGVQLARRSHYRLYVTVITRTRPPETG